MTFREIEAGDWKTLARSISADGVVFVNRMLDWNATDAARGKWPKGIRGETPGSFTLPQPWVWRQEEAWFEKAELDSAEFRRNANRLRVLVQSTESGYPGTVTCSVKMVDSMSRSSIGPALGGKICASDWWYICYRQEDGLWKIYKIEVVLG